MRVWKRRGVIIMLMRGYVYKESVTIKSKETDFSGKCLNFRIV